MTTSSQNLARQVADQVKVKARSLAKDIARQVGTPMDGQALSRAEQARLWNLRNPASLTPEGMLQVQQMLAAGQHAQALTLAYPWRKKLIGQGSPSEQADRAEQLAKLAQEVSGDG